MLNEVLRIEHYIPKKVLDGLCLAAARLLGLQHVGNPFHSSSVTSMLHTDCSGMHVLQRLSSVEGGTQSSGWLLFVPGHLARTTVQGLQTQFALAAVLPVLHISVQDGSAFTRLLAL
jgi:hypothetical protein